MSYNRNVQYVSLVSYTSLTSPDDVWKLSSPYILPVKCNQIALGYFRNFSSNAFETSVEVYYKQLTDLVEYKNGAKLSMNHTIETELMNAKGKNYGAELFLKKNGGTIEGWMSYTYSGSLRQTTSNYTEEQVNENAVYPSPFDKPHDYSLMATYHQNKRLSVSIIF